MKPAVIVDYALLGIAGVLLIGMINGLSVEHPAFEAVFVSSLLTGLVVAIALLAFRQKHGARLLTLGIAIIVLGLLFPKL